MKPAYGISGLFAVVVYDMPSSGHEGQWNLHGEYQTGLSIEKFESVEESVWILVVKLPIRIGDRLACSLSMCR